MRIIKSATVVGATLCMLGAGSVAMADSTPSKGPIRMFFTYQTPVKEKILITGAVADYGMAISADANGKANPNGNFEKVTLKKGGFVLNLSALTKSIQKQFKKEPINRSNCSLALSGTGPGTIETGTGTGAYANISGSLRITLTVAGIAPKTKKGQCNLSTPAPFSGEYQAVTATGSVSLG
jgi:hypothetical protein